MKIVSCLLLQLCFSGVVIRGTRGTFVPCNGNAFFSCSISGRCILLSEKCDGVPQCADGTDELFCEQNPCEGQEWFKCGNGNCIAARWKCDGQNDCLDHSDEVGCKSLLFGGGSKSTDVTCKNKDEFSCDGLCLPNTWRCDGNKDCMDGMDEDPSFCDELAESLASNTTESSTEKTSDRRSDDFNKPFPVAVFSSHCSGTNFRCGGENNTDGECLPSRWKCDGVKDCPDGDDEDNCGVPGISELECDQNQGWFLCADQSKCIRSRLVCDNHLDCDDKSDEGLSCTSPELLNQCKRCSQNCLRQPDGNSTSCYCDEGYKLDEDGITCSDINECEQYGTCSQTCVNTRGGFECQCQEGYDKVMNTSCLAQRFMPQLIFSTKNEIRSINLRTREYSLTASNVIHSSKNGAPHAVGVSYDPVDDRVYWTDVEQNREMIVSSRLNGFDKKQVVTSGLDIPEDIAVDFLVRNIYFTDNGRKHIGVCHISGYHCSILISKGVDSPRAISLHHSKGILFYTDWGRTPQIVKAGMDGSDVTPIIQKDIKWPNGVTVDVAIDRIFWSDAHFDWIESSKLDGSDRRRLMEQHIKHPFSVAVFEDTIYWSDWQDQYIQACNKFTGKSHRYVIKEKNLTPMGIHVTHPLIEQTGYNPCIAAHCSHLCLLAPPGNKFTCGCPIGMKLDSNKRTCKSTSDTPSDSISSSQIIVSSGNKISLIRTQKLGRSLSQDLTVDEPGLANVSALAYNPLNNTLYFGDKGTKRIYSLNIVTRKYEIIAVGYSEDLAYDVYANNLYWTDSETNSISVKSLNNGAVRSLITRLDKPTAIDIIHHLKLLVFTEARDYPSVKVSTLTGTNIETLPGLDNVKKPVALAVDESDTANTLIYIADTFKGTIIEYNFAKRAAKIFNNKLAKPTSLVLNRGGNLLWSESHGSSMYWFNKAKQLKSKTLEDYTTRNSYDELRIVGLSRMSDEEIHRFNAPCRYNNGGCSDLCFNGRGTETFCQCTEGKEMNPNNSSLCHYKCEEGLYHCGNGQCIPPRWQCDGVEECHNGKDELNCPEKPACHSAFECANTGYCIPQQWKCDGTSDCSDNSDEDGCPDILCDPEYKIKCADNKKCILKAWQCDGFPDCDDGSDENDCSYHIINIDRAVDNKSPNQKNNATLESKLDDTILEQDNILDGEVVRQPVTSDTSNRNRNLAIGLTVPLFFILVIVFIVIIFVKYKRRKFQKNEVTLRFRNPTFGIDDRDSIVTSANNNDKAYIQNQGDTTFNAYDNPGYDTPNNPASKSNNTSRFSMYPTSSEEDGSTEDVSKLRRVKTDPSGAMNGKYSPLGGGRGGSSTTIETDSAFVSIPSNNEYNYHDVEEESSEHLSVSYTTRDKSYLLGN